MIRTGTMKHQIEIRRSTEYKDDNGFVRHSYALLNKVRASINPVTGNELFVNSQIINEITHKIGVRYTDVTEKDQIIFNGRKFNVVQVLNFNEQKVNLIILAKEIKNDN